MNVLWIMCDQLRFDYLSCAGHPHLQTPHIDALAAKGVRFTNAYVQSPICGPSRMSSYTGRYVRSHGSTWNFFPLRVGEPTLGDHLREIGVRPVLVGKTHMFADEKGMERLGIDPASDIGVRVSECGFEPFERDDGLHPTGRPGRPNYEDYLHQQGLEAENPWQHLANSGTSEDGELLSGWLLKYSNAPANVPEEHSETPYMTRRAMEFMESAGDTPWLCHLSFIKPHWPYIVPAPYHDMYGLDDIIPPVRSDMEKHTDHPVYRAYIESRICKTFARDEVRERVIPAYMGLIKQIDDQMGVLFKWMKERGMMDDTMIVFTSDHGDYLGDHWMGEKDLFHEQSVKIPLIIYDPCKEADATRGMVRDELVEGIDLAPTFLSAFGGEAKPHIMEGLDITPLLHDPAKPADWRRYAVSEYDYGTREARLILGIDEKDARLVMMFDGRWKYVHAETYRPMLFDLETDPQELVDLGDSAESEHVAVRERMRDAMMRWALAHHNRITRTADQIETATQEGEPPGILIGFWDEADYEDYFGRKFVP